METFLHLSRQYRPREGWLAPLLLFGAVGFMVASVLAVGWVREDIVVIPTALIGFLMGSVLGGRSLKSWAAWVLILLYGLLITTLTLAQLWPPLYLLLGQWAALRQFWLENGALFFDRASGWLQAMAIGSSSNETIVFAFLMGILAWSLAAFAGWSAFRLRRPLLGLTVMSMAVAVNGYFGEAPLTLVVGFAATAVLGTAVFHFSDLEAGWEGSHVDFSTEIRFEALLYATAISVAIIGAAFLLPALSPSRLARAVLSMPVFTSVEETYERAFAGVEPPREMAAAPGQAGGPGIMPRSFLLGNPPELETTIMLTAEAQVSGGSARGRLGLIRHWRGLSYEIYDGRGWTLGEERTELVEAGEPVPLAEVEETFLIEQQVNWRFDNRILRYTLGFPNRFNQDTTSYWRGESDFVRAVSREGPRYNTLSSFSAAGPAQLRTVSLEAVPASILERYTQLPDDLPRRIRDLAEEVTVEAQTPYDQALALESFLRQYPYSLEVTLPPQGSDPVDYFLFDLQMGYCDYYASAMAVMARSIGLPARVATGFLVPAEDESGVQTVRQIDSHSWAEIYFAEYGWIEFEPTAAFLTPHDPSLRATLEEQSQEETETNAPETPPIPERAPQPEIDWRWVLLGLALAGLLVLGTWWWSRRPRYASAIDRAYSRLQGSAGRLGQGPAPSQTPSEFSADFVDQLQAMEDERPHLRPLIKNVSSPIRQLTDLFVRQQYSGRVVEETQAAATLWQRIRRPLFILWLNKSLSGSRKE